MGFLKFCQVGSVLVLMALAAACEDQRVSTSAPRIDRFHVSDSQQSPDPSQFESIPEKGTLNIDFGKVEVGSLSEKFLFLRNTGRSDLKLNSVTFGQDSSGDFEINCSAGGPFEPCPDGTAESLAVIPGSNLTIRVMYGPADRGEDLGEFVVVSNATEHGSLTVSLHGQGVSPEIEVCMSDCTGAQDSPECQQAGHVCNDEVAPEDLSLEFGDTELGPAMEREIYLSNSGDSRLEFAGISIGGGDYSVFSADGGPMGLDAGEQQVLKVYYSPSMGGDHASTLSISSNDPDEPSVNIALSGRALAPRLCPQPLALDFGNVSTGESSVLAFKVTNCGLLTLTLNSLVMAASSSTDFSLHAPPATPVDLAPGESVEVEVEYHPADTGSDSGGVELYSNDPASDSNTGLTGTISILGSSVPRACDIMATPFSVNFGGVVQGQTAEVDLIVSNVGTDECVIHSVEITQNSADDEFDLAGLPDADAKLAPGDAVTMKASYSPVDLGDDSGSISIFCNDKDTDEIQVPLVGRGIEEAVCDLEISPGALWFGTVKVYHTKSMGLVLNNHGEAPCEVSDVRLESIPFVDHDFTITSVPVTPFTIAPRGEAGSQQEIELTMAPDEEYMFARMAILHIDANDDDFGNHACTDGNGLPIPNEACITVSGFAKYSDLEVVPEELDFGLVTLGCNSPERCVTLYNLGSQQMSLTEVSMQDAADANFSIRSAPMLPFDLVAGGSVKVCLRYTPQDLGAHRNALYLKVDDEELTIPVFGRGTDSSAQTDVFHQLDNVKADVLFVVDCSGSMGDNQQNLADNFSSFINQAVTMDVDFHIGVVSTEVEDQPGWTGTPPREVKPGYLVQAGSRPKIITSTTPDLNDAFTDNVRLGDDCSAHEAGLEGAWMALSQPLVDDPNANAGFLREDAKLYIIAVSDEPDQSNGSVDFYVDFFSSLKGYRNTEMMSVSAICTSCDSDRYWDVTVRTGGICEPIDSVDWAQSLANMGIDAFSAIREFPLSRPADPNSIAVSVDGSPVNRASSEGGADGWTHYADTNTLFFGDNVVPDRGQRIEVTYSAMCY